jgi:hypothetical protein
MAERNIGRRNFLIGVAEVFVGGAVFGKGFTHLAEGVMTHQGRRSRVRAELEAQGVTDPSEEVLKTAKEIIREDNQKPMAERNPELVGQATQHLTQKLTSIYVTRNFSLEEALKKAIHQKVIIMMLGLWS